ncbi:MAG: hypothetical protein LBR26_10905 [Prevotella sp.]|jgi:hypothetical protein|nr:hypothetical protein [Prevotella sp.]
MIDRIYKYAEITVSKPSVSSEIEKKGKLLQNTIIAFYDCCCKKTNSANDVDSKEAYQFFNKYFHRRFIEMINIDDVCLFEDDVIRSSLMLTQNRFNREITFLHKNCVQTNNRIWLKGLVLQSEKEFWGDALELLRNNPIVDDMEQIKSELNLAKGKMRTANEPVAYAEQLREEIYQDFFGNTYTKEEWNNLWCCCAAIQQCLDNQQTEKTIISLSDDKDGTIEI